MSFFRKIKTDSVIFKDKKKSSDPKARKKSSDSDTGSFSHDGKTMYFNKCSKIHFGPEYTLSSTHIVNNTSCEKKCAEDESDTFLPHDVEDNFSRIDEPTLEQFVLVSEDVSDGWRELGLQLGFSQSDLKEYSSEEEDILKLLFAWKKAETRQATVGRLIKALWDAHEYKAAKRLSANVSCHHE